MGNVLVSQQLKSETLCPFKKRWKVKEEAELAPSLLGVEAPEDSGRVATSQKREVVEWSSSKRKYEPA